MPEKFFLRNIAVFLLIITIPYLFAWCSAGTDLQFGGFLLNPSDGNSYLAKMVEGLEGSWSFTLPYTADPGEGEYIFLFYIFLGHLSRLIDTPPLWVFHLARIAGAIFMAWNLARFLGRLYNDRLILTQWAFRFALFGSGLGWLVIWLGVTTSDLWVAEAYPFLSSYSNPHFCFGLGLLLWMMRQLVSPFKPRKVISLIISGLLLSIIMPFGIIHIGAVGLIFCVWEWFAERRTNALKSYGMIMLLGGPFLLYQYWVIQSHPVLQIWNSQNQTPSPLFWDFMISFSPAILLAFWATLKMARLEKTPEQRLLMTWLVLGLLLIYFPFPLQRRFMFGFYVPVAALAVQGLAIIQTTYIKRESPRIYFSIFSLSIITNLVVLLLAFFGVTNRSPLLYITRQEKAAMEFIYSSLPKDAVILCSPEVGNLIPAWTGRRVLYGHEFETVNATPQKAIVESLLSGATSSEKFFEILAQERVTFIFWGPHEQKYGTPDFLMNSQIVYQNSDVTIFSR